MKAKLIFLKTLIVLILFNTNIGHIECMDIDGYNGLSSTSSEIYWEDTNYAQGDTYTVNVYFNEMLYCSAVTCTHAVIVSLPPSDDIKIELIKHETGNYTSFKVLSIVTLEDNNYRYKIFL